MNRARTALRDPLHTLHELRRQQEHEAAQELSDARAQLQRHQQSLRDAHQAWIDRCQPEATLATGPTAGSLQRRAACDEARLKTAGDLAQRLRQARAAAQRAEQAVAVAETHWHQACADRQALHRTQARHTHVAHQQAQRRLDDDDEDLAQHRRPAS